MKKQKDKNSGQSRAKTNDGDMAKPQSAPEEPAAVAKIPIPWKQIALYSALALGLFAIIWVVCGLLFSRVDVGGTSVAGIKSGAALEKLVSSKAEDFRLTLVSPEGQKSTYKMSAMGIQANPAATVKDIRKAQNKFSQRIFWWRPVVAKLNTTVSTSALDTFISQHARIVTQPAQNAGLSITDGAVKTTPAANGRQIGLNDANDALLNAARGLQSKTLQLQPTALKPTVTETSLTSTKSRLEGILGQTITINIGSEAVKPSAQDIGQWITLTPTATGVDIGTDENKINEYLTNLADSNSRSPQSQVVSDSTGKILTAGSKGVTVGGVESAASAIKNDVLSGKGMQTSLSVSYTDFKTISAPISTPISGRWIEVDLTAKRLYAYDNGSIANTFLISAGAPGTPTPTGRFSIYAKYRSQDMTGPNLDGTTYYQPAVPYVNYFTGAYAIHGNYWRPASYFGNIHSSHGCVGLPVDDSAWLYSWAPIGTPVVVHW